MPERKTFEEIQSELMAQNPHMSAVDATAYIRQQVDAGHPDYAAIPGVHGKLASAYMSSIAHGAVKGFAETIGPGARAVGSGLSALGISEGEDIAQRFSPENIEAFGKKAEPAPWSEFGGQALGIGAYESAAGPLGALVPGVSRGAKIAKGVAGSLALQKVGALGNMKPGEAMLWGGVFPAAAGLAEKLGIFGRAAEVPPTEEGEPPAPAPSTPEDYAQKYRRLRGLSSEAEAPVVAPRNPAIEQVPANMRPGQPFESQFMTRQRSTVSGADMFAPQGHPIYGSGPAYPANWNKPFVIDVPDTGPDGWRHAAQSVFSKNPAAVERLQTAKDPEGLAQAMVANELKKRGYDAVSLNTPNLQGVTLDLRTFKGGATHPEMTPDLFKFQKVPKKEGPFVHPKTLKAADAGEAVFGAAKGKRAPKDSPFEQARAHAMGDPTLADSADAAHKSVIERAKSQAAGDVDAAEVAKGNDRLTGHTGGYSPEVRDAIAAAPKRSRGWIVRWLAPQYMSDHPQFQGMIQDTMTQVAASNRQAAEWEKRYKQARELVPDFKNPAKFDEIARAVDGLRYEPENGYASYTQTALHVPEWANKAARAFAQFRDEGYTFLTGNDARVPYVLESRGLSHNRRQLERLRLLLTDEGTRALESGGKRGLPTETEYQVANELRGIPGALGFNSTHDLDFDPITGWMKFHPHANEKAMLEDGIKQMAAMKEGRPDYEYGFADQAKLEEMLKRNKELEDRDLKRHMSREPNRDFVPRRKWMSILHGQESPYFYSTDPDEIMSQWVTGVTQKRIADVNLARTKGLLRDATVDGPTQDYAVEYANAVRGAKGYAGDLRFARGMENAFYTMGFKDVKISPSEVHKWTGTLQELNFFGKMGLSPMRFPIINMTHLFPTAGAVAEPATFARGVMSAIFDYPSAIEQAQKAGVISQDLEWFKEMGMNKEGRISKIGRPLRALAYITENFRKAAAYQIGLKAAERGEFAPVVRGFINDINKYGGNRQLMNEAYARAFTFTTQFEFGKTGKAVAMQGGPMIRAATQFRSWESNMIGLYKEMLHQRDFKGFTRGIAALMFLGGAGVVGPLGTYSLLRKELLRWGYNLPDKPLWHYGMALAGLKGTAVDQIDIRSLSDPFGFSQTNTLASLAGPTFGSIVTLGQNIIKDVDKGQTYKIPRELVNAVAPQAQDMIDAAQEYMAGGVMGPGGMIDKNRSWLAIAFRGLDLMPSVASQRAKFEDDIEAAMVSGNVGLVESLKNEMTAQNLTMTPDMARRMRAYVRGHQRAARQPWAF